MTFELWVLFIGAVLFAMGIAAPHVQRLPFPATLVYLLLGCAMGPLGAGWIQLNPIDHLAFFHRGAEVTVVISLFAVGAKLRLPLLDRRWIPTLTLAVISMTLTVALIAWVGTRFMGLPLGAAVLLGAILAPTDPVLASDVQVKHPHDGNAMRVTLSGEAGLNDGTAFPFVMLGLGLLGLHDLGEGLSRWWAKDVAWSVFGGLAIGGALGLATGKIATALRTRRANAVFWDEYLLVGLIALSYGIAVTAGTYGFLSVFAAGVSVRAIERMAMENAPRVDRGTDDAPPVEMARALLDFNEQIERILEVGMVILVGSALFVVGVSPACLWFVPLFFLVLRPLAVLPARLVFPFPRREFAGIAWFGIRGIGSLYYLSYALSHGVASELARTLASITLTVIAASIVVHGLTIAFVPAADAPAADRASATNS